MLDGEITDLVEAQSLRHARDYIDIYSISWGPKDDGKTVDGPGPLTKIALEEGSKFVSYTAKNTVILPDFLPWKFCGKGQYPQNFGRFTRNYVETVSYHNISKPGNQVKLR